MWRGSLVVRPVGDDELGRFAAELTAHHWLVARLSGQVVRYVATVDGEWVALAGSQMRPARCRVRADQHGQGRPITGAGKRPQTV
jgi:hypothetical protein